MGYTGTWCNEYTKSGRVDAKKFLDKELSQPGDGVTQAIYRVEKSCMVGNTYYAALYNKDKGKEHVFAAVVLVKTGAGRNGEPNLCFKSMSEYEGPHYYDCPPSILSLLTPTDDAECLKWRRRCYIQHQMNARKKMLAKMPIGTQIEVLDTGSSIVLTKRSPAYQFKRDWWQCDSGFYFPISRIPCDYDIVGTVDEYNYPETIGEQAYKQAEKYADEMLANLLHG